MSDLQWLFLILALFYAWECLCWVRRGSVAFVTLTGKKWRLKFPGTLFGNQRGGFILANPFPPQGNILIASEFALSLSPEVAFAHSAINSSPGWRALHTGRFARYENIREVVARGKTLVVNGEKWVHFSAPATANHHAELLKRLIKLKPDQRATTVREFIGEALDEREVTRRWKEFQTQTQRLRWLCNALVVYLFAFAPAMIWRLGLQLSWLPLLLGLFSVSIWAGLIFRRLHRGWYPDLKDERFSQTMIVALAPASGARAMDHLSRPMLETFHPLAVAKAFLPETEFRLYARRALLDLRHPALPLTPTTDAGAVEAERFMRAELRLATEKFLKRHGLNLDELCAPPKPVDETCRAYCPRCGAQFTTPDSPCEDCGGLVLFPFAHSQPIRA